MNRSTFWMITYMNGSVFFKGQIYEWSRFWNTGSHTRTTITPTLPLENIAIIYNMIHYLSRDVRKRTFGHVHPANIQIRLRSLCSESSLIAFWIHKDTIFHHVRRYVSWRCSTFQVLTAEQRQLWLDTLPSRKHANSNILKISPQKRRVFR